MYREIILVTILSFLSHISIAQNVGIGTMTPTARLHVEVPNGFSGPSFQVNVTGSSVPQMVILADGKVGIGVSNPQEVLDISGNVRFSGALMPGGDPGAAGQVLVSQGPGVSPQWQVLSGDDWGGQVAVTQVPIVGDGTGSNPIGLQSGSATGDILVWDGSVWQVVQPGSTSGVAPLCNSPSINVLQKWTGVEMCNSQIYDDGTNVGIGTTSPVYKLDVVGSGRFSGSLTIGNYTLPAVDGASGQVLVTDGLGNVTWQTISVSGGDNWGSQVAITQGVVVGDGTSGNPIRLQNGSVSGDILVWDGSQWVIQQPVSSGGVNTCGSVGVNYVQKWTGSQLCNSVIYDDGTNVGIGTNNPLVKLHVSSMAATTSMGISSNARVWFIFHSYSTNTGYAIGTEIVGVDTILQINYDRPAGTAFKNILMAKNNGFVGLGINPTHHLHLSSDDAAKTTTSTWIVTSDERAKTNIMPYNKGLKEILSLEPITYQFTPEAAEQLGISQTEQQRRHVGFSAQNVMTVFPEAVVQSEPYLGLNIHPILIAYTNAIKELNGENQRLRKAYDSLQQQINELKQTIQQLESQVK